jgi:hypothetical protein
MSMSQTRDEVIRGRLDKMTDWAKERRDFLANPPKGWKEDWYIRIGGNGYTAVSLDYEHPLLGFGAGSTKDIEKVRSHFYMKQKDICKSVPERHAQAWLIKKAVNNKLSLKTCLGLDGSLYDELLFALDEVSFGDRNHLPILRFDILAVGICDGNAFPVSIELKSGRHLKELQKQLREYQALVKLHGQQFTDLLKTCTNVEVNFSKYGRIIVWPKSQSGKVSDKVEECAQQKVTIIESDTDNWSDIREFSFHPFREVCPPTPFFSET